MPSTADRVRAALRGRYAIERELGHGGMATVFLARDLKHSRHVALKVLRPELAAAVGPERFGREITIAAQLQHPNILTLIDSGAAGDVLYYVMPFVEGESLRDRLAREGALPVAEAVRLLRDIVDGLAHAHRHGVVHRDIKPGNVMLAEGHAMVVDFGIARAMSDATEAEDLTSTGFSVGTPSYMAPEQVAGDPGLDHRADIYSVGVVAYEMLAGARPFTGSHQAVLAAQISKAAEPVADRRPDVEPALAAVVTRCLEKDPDARFQSAEALLTEIEALGGRGAPSAGPMATASGQRRVWLAALLAIGLVGGAAYAMVARARQVRWVHEEAIPAIRGHIDHWAFDSAYALAVRAERIAPDDPALRSLWSSFSETAVFRTTPEGAAVYRAPYADTSRWELLGTTPMDSIRLAFPSRIRIEKPGFRTAYTAFEIPQAGIVLDSVGAAHPEMVRVSGGDFPADMPGLEHVAPLALSEFLMDRHEVTNAQYEAFVAAGGYARPEYWDHEFVSGGRRLSFGEAMTRLTDRTGRPGPATWITGTFPDGERDLPVTGVSWYEAAAFAKFVGKSLPTIYHWNHTATFWLSPWIVPGSNFGGVGPVVGNTFYGMGRFGTFDMAGNVREWCENAVADRRYILGGGWSDPPDHYTDAYAQDPFDRSAINGIRLVKYLHEEPNLELAKRPPERLVRDYAKERPVATAVFETYRRMYDYDAAPLNVREEARDTTADHWITEHVSFSAAYGSERVPALLLLPKNTPPPFQAVVYFPGSDALYVRSTEVPARYASGLDHFMKSGRAVILPVYKSTFGRGDGFESPYPDETIDYRDHVLMWAKDMRRAIDYLETRPDIDTTRLAYYGLSWGGYLGGLMPAVEPRIKVAVLQVAGLLMQRPRPEVDPLNFLPRVTVPVLMLNGRLDHFFPVETGQKPMFGFLGTPAEHKRWVVYEGGHVIPRTQVIIESLAWLDKHLGPVQ